MSLIGHVPGVTALSADTFQVVGSGSDEKRLLMLSAPHSVHCELKSGIFSGSATVDYVLQADMDVKSIGESLKTSKKLAKVGFQSSDELRNLAESLKMKQSFVAAALGDSEFDLRALAYVCGAAAAATASGCRFDLTQSGMANVRLASPTWTVPSLTELTVAPGLAKTGPEFATLARLCAIAGTKTIVYMSDVAPPSTNYALDGLEVGAYALRLFSTIVSSAQSCACAAHHVLAFYKGMNHVWTLWAHTDEGGWIRKPLRSALYPKCCGVLSPLGAAYFNIPTSKSLAPEYVLQVTMGLFLEFTGTLVTSDKGDDGPIAVMHREIPGSTAASFPLLRSEFYQLLKTFRARIAKDYDLHPSNVGDEESSEMYFRSPPEDSHLDRDVFIPFFWVEPGPLTVKERDYPLPMRQGVVTELPMANGVEVIRSPGYLETRGCAAMGSTVFLKQRSPRPRMDGYQYLMSPRYRPENGLSLCEVVVEPRAGVFSRDALFVEPDAVRADERRWVTPHNPCANPVEGISDSAQLTKYTYRGRKYEPLAGEWATAKVGSMTGSFVVRAFARYQHAKPQVTHVSERLKNWVARFNHSRPATMIELAQFPLDYESTAPVDTRIDTPVITQTPIAVEPVNEAAVPTTATGPETTVYASRDTGQRIRPPDAELEPEEPPGEGDSSPPS